MHTEIDRNGLISMLKVLDTCLEMQVNAVNGYSKIAEKVGAKSSKAVLNWLYNNESTRMRQLAAQRRTILQRYPELINDGGYKPRENSGLSKMGVLKKAEPLDIMRYAIENELRAMRFFERKAAASGSETEQRMFRTAAFEQKDRLEYFGAHRQALMQQQIEYGAEQLAIAV